MSISQHYDQGRDRLKQAGSKIASTVKSQILPTDRKRDTHTDKPYRVLSAPLVTLFVSPSKPRESEEAFEILAASRAAFWVEESTDGMISARFAGKHQYGIEGITNLSEGLQSFGRILLDPCGDEKFAAELERRYDPALGARARAELAEYNRLARADLDRLLHEPSASERYV